MPKTEVWSKYELYNQLIKAGWAADLTGLLVENLWKSFEDFCGKEDQSDPYVAGHWLEAIALISEGHCYPSTKTKQTTSS